jgi:hypothetical protein
MLKFKIMKNSHLIEAGLGIVALLMFAPGCGSQKPVSLPSQITVENLCDFGNGGLVSVEGSLTFVESHDENSSSESLVSPDYHAYSKFALLLKNDISGKKIDVIQIQPTHIQGLRNENVDNVRVTGTVWPYSNTNLTKQCYIQLSDVKLGR